MKREVFIPFCGFYESWIDMMIDNHLEQEAEEFGITIDQNFRVNFEGIAREYVELYEATLHEEAMGELGRAFNAPRFTFKELISPREYNFETDRILCEVDDVTKLWAVRQCLVGTDSLHQDIKDRFKSRDGFASFYDDFVSEWKDKPLEDWDCNELSILLPNYDFEDFDLDLTNFHEAIYNNVEVLHDEEG